MRCTVTMKFSPVRIEEKPAMKTPTAVAITQVFEKRVIGQYHQHLRLPGTHPQVQQTIERIMRDERWHVKYVREALAAMAGRYGHELIEQTLARYTAADEEIYAKTLGEYGERIDFLAQTPARRSV